MLVVPRRHCARNAFAVSLVLFVLFQDQVRGYEFTEGEPSLVGKKSYPIYIRCVFRLHEIAYQDFSPVRQRCLETTVGKLISLEGDATELVELSKIEEFDPKGPKGGPGTSCNVDFKIFAERATFATSARAALLEVRATPSLFETKYKSCLAQLNHTLPSGFYLFVQVGPETLMNELPGRNDVSLIVSSIFCALIGVGIVLSQALRRYDFNPTLPPTAKVDTSKYEYVLETDDGEEKKQD